MQKKSIAIISDNSASVILAADLIRDGHAVSIVHTGQKSFSDQQIFKHNLQTCPQNELVKEALTSLNNLLVSPLQITEISEPLSTVQDGETKTFVGFGDAKSVAVPIYSRINLPTRFLLPDDMGTKIYSLLNNSKIKVHDYSELTQIDFSSTNSVEKVIINGSETIYADIFVFLGAPQELVSVLSDAHLGNKTRSRIAKSSRYARIASETSGNFASDRLSQLYVLIPNQQDQPICVGRFFETRTVWESYIANETCEDAEYVSSIIRSMRKQVTKAFPDVTFNNRDVISVEPDAAADFSWTLESRELSEIADNFVFSPTLASELIGPSQCIESAYRAYKVVSEKVMLSTSSAQISTPSLLDSNASC